MSFWIHCHHRQAPFVAYVQKSNATSARRQLKQMLQEHRDAGNTVEETSVGMLRRFKVYDAAGWMATLWMSDQAPAIAAASPTPGVSAAHAS